MGFHVHLHLAFLACGPYEPVRVSVNSLTGGPGENDRRAHGELRIGDGLFDFNCRTQLMRQSILGGSCIPSAASANRPIPRRVLETLVVNAFLDATGFNVGFRVAAASPQRGEAMSG